MPTLVPLHPAWITAPSLLSGHWGWCQGNLPKETLKEGDFEGQAALPAEWLTWKKDFTPGTGRRRGPSSPVEGDDEQRKHKINWTRFAWSLLQHAHVKARKCPQGKIMDNGVRHKQSRGFLDVECTDEQFPADAAWVRGRECPQQGCWWHKTGRRGWGSFWHPEIPEIHRFLHCEGHWPQEQPAQTRCEIFLTQKMLDYQQQLTPGYACLSRGAADIQQQSYILAQKNGAFFLIFYKCHI